MPWSYKSPLTFPARYPTALRSAVANFQTPVLLHSGPPGEITSEAERFRYYRWCLRENPDVDRTLAHYLSIYQFRTSIDAEHFWTGSGYEQQQLLYLTAKPGKFTELSDLNPHLQDIFLSADCQ